MSNPSTPKRMRYAASSKLKLAKEAVESNNSSAARNHGISEKLVRDWRKVANELKDLPSTKCANRGQNQEKWPKLEKEIVRWVLSERLCGKIVTR